MKGFVQDIKVLASQNSKFRRVLYTGSGLQLVLMSLKSDEDIGELTPTSRHRAGDGPFYSRTAARAASRWRSRIARNRGNVKANAVSPESAT